MLSLELLAPACANSRRNDDDDDSAPDDDDSAPDDDDDASDDDDTADDDDTVEVEIVLPTGNYTWLNDLSPEIEALGLSDCTHVWLVQPAAGPNSSGCPGCTVQMRVDLLYQSNDCSAQLGTLANVQADFTDVEVGLAGEFAWLYEPDPGDWGPWMTVGGVLGSNSYTGSSEEQDFGQYVRTQGFEVTW